MNLDIYSIDELTEMLQKQRAVIKDEINTAKTIKDEINRREKFTSAQLNLELGRSNHAR